ncbi:MAG: SUF system NifU family Fe-S cluster assembly protein [Deltaproteobacteria bacterium CG11_big_fil_rev_8_21_14_0_20_47_16]|nr:MAG: SUF system NifU family Fe-S cluster assembly protein [Deltaproteobacteria bacterium CG11_big_fil_rev_8_21_14_0_20_47_16]
MDNLDSLYREVILDHFQNPRHHGALTEPTVAVDGKNPLCGDEITLQLSVENGVIKDVAWDGKGCAISQASISVLAENVVGKTIIEAKEMINNVKGVMNGSVEVETLDMGDLEALAGVRQFPVRIKCALLGWTTLEEAFKELNI